MTTAKFREASDGLHQADTANYTRRRRSRSCPKPRKLNVGGQQLMSVLFYQFKTPTFDEKHVRTP